MRPDPKRPRRHRDPQAVYLAALAQDECAACGNPPGSGHHVVPKGAPHFGDDVPANVLAVCGTGTAGCHGAFHAGDLDARRRLGATVRRRPRTLRYVLDRLGEDAGREFLRRRYLIDFS